MTGRRGLEEVILEYLDFSCVRASDSDQGRSQPALGAALLSLLVKVAGRTQKTDYLEGGFEAIECRARAVAF